MFYGDVIQSSVVGTWVEGFIPLIHKEKNLLRRGGRTDYSSFQGGIDVFIHNSHSGTESENRCPLGGEEPGKRSDGRWR